MTSDQSPAAPCRARSQVFVCALVRRCAVRAHGGSGAAGPGQDEIAVRAESAGVLFNRLCRLPGRASLVATLVV